MTIPFKPNDYYVSTGFHFGHPIYIHRDEYTIKNGRKCFSKWRWVHSDIPINEERPPACPKCRKMPTKDNHDPCIANLPNVIHACCGHGVEEPYVMFSDRSVLRGKEAEKFFNEVLK